MKILPLININTNQGQTLTTLILAGFLSVGNLLTIPETAIGASTNLSLQTNKQVVKEDSKSNTLPRKVVKAVLRDLSRRENIPINKLKIVNYQQKTWKDGCFGLGGPAELCYQTLVPGWEVLAGNGSRTWTYRTNKNGSQIRLDEKVSDRIGVRLPKNIRYAVLQDAASWSKISPSKLSIIKAERKIWDNPCFLTFKRYCNFAFIKTPGWIVTVKGGKQTWVYHTDDKASVVALDRTPSLSKAAATAIKKDAAKRASGRKAQRYLSSSNFRIIEVKKLKNWNGKRLRQPGWEATISNGQQSWVYRVNENGSEFKYLSVASLPQSIIDAVLTDAKVRARSRVAISENNIIEAKQVRWRNSCLGLRSGGRYCAMRLVDGWRVTVKAGPESFVYHTNNRSRVKFNAAASQTIGDIASSKALPIPKRELPSSLSKDAIFRQISSGGFSGSTYQMILLKDGRLMLSRVGDANDSSRAVWRISRSQVQKFQKLLQRNRREFSNVNYPASRSAADYQTYTLTSPRGSVQYNDISRENLPEDLQVIVQAWNSLIRSAKR